jgi:hypothetical protein
MRDGGGAKQRIDSRTAAVFTRSLRYQKLIFLDQQMVIRRSYVDPPWFKRLSILCQATMKAPVPTQPMDQGVGCILRRHVLNDENRSRKIARQLTDKIIQSVQTSGGSPNDDNVTSFVSHNASLSASLARVTDASHLLFDIVRC